MNQETGGNDRPAAHRLLIRPVGPPIRDLHPTTDIRFVIWQMGKLEERIRELVSEIKKQADQIATLNLSMVKFKTAFFSIMACLAIFLPVLGTIIWWAIVMLAEL